MSSVNSLGTGQYYQLPTGTGDATVTTPVIGTSSGSGLSSELASLLNGDSDSVDLSPQAQSILDAINGTTSASGFSSSLSGLSGANSSFSLSYAQQQQISSILSKYADAPMTQDTFDSIQSDLAAAGLSPSQLSQMDSLQSFNSTQVFLDALNGQTDSIPTADDSTEQTKSSNYMQQIYTEWKDMDKAGSGSGTAGASSGSGISSASGASA